MRTRELMIDDTIAVEYDEESGAIEAVQVYNDFLDDWITASLPQIEKNKRFMKKLQDKVDEYRADADERSAQSWDDLRYQAAIEAYKGI